MSLSYKGEPGFRDMVVSSVANFQFTSFTWKQIDSNYSPSKPQPPNTPFIVSPRFYQVGSSVKIS